MPTHEPTLPSSVTQRELPKKIFEPGAFQEKSVVHAFDIPGFNRLEVVATLEKRDTRKKDRTQRNQDNILADPETGLLGVFDGLGGREHGDLASMSAERALPDAYRDALEKAKKISVLDLAQEIADHQSNRLIIRDRLHQQVVRARIMNAAEDLVARDPEIARKSIALILALKAVGKNVRETMGDTTACVGVVHASPDGSRYAVVANAGDSGAFIRRADGSVKRLTEEGSYLNKLRALGYLSDELLQKMKDHPAKEFDVQTPDGKREYTYPDLQAIVIGTLWNKNIQPSLAIEKLQPGDELLFVTDGVIDKYDDPTTDDVDTAKMAEALRNGETLRERMNAFRRYTKILTTYKSDDDIAILVANVMEK